MARQEAWTKAAVECWSDAKVKAWRERRTNVNAYLYRFCAPGQDQTNGAFSAAEQRLLEQRVAEFKQRGWPLACWGLFSLAIPGRVGYQCAAQYRKTLGAGEQDGTRATAAESAACMAHHAPQIEAMWGSAAAERLCSKVDHWLQERQAQELKRGAGGQAAGSAAGAVPKAAKAAAAPAVPRPLPGAGWCDSDSDGFEDALSPAAVRTRPEPAGVPLPKKQQAPAGVATGPGCVPPGGASSRWPTAAPAAVAVPNPAGRTSQAASAGAWWRQQQQHEERQQQREQQWVKNVQQPSAAPQQPSARPLSSFAFGTARSVQQPAALPARVPAEPPPLQQQLPAREQLKHAVANPLGRRGAASPQAGLGPGGHKANVESSLQHGPASSKPRPKVPGLRHSGGGAGRAGPASKDPGSAKAPAAARKAVGSDSEEEFEPGSLRRAPLPVASSHPPAASTAAAPKPPKPSGKRKRVWRAEGGQASLVVAEDFLGPAMGAGTLEDPTITSIKLQPGSMPGWACREVAPYCPPQPAAAAAAGEAGATGGQVVAVADALAFDLASLGGGFQGVLLNAHLVDAAAPLPGPSMAGAAAAPSPPQRTSCSAAQSVAPPSHGITTTQLASLISRIDGRVVASGILCVWANKRHLVEVVNCMAEAGFQYVESLTWVQLAASGNILQARSSYLNSSHLSLLLGRKGAASSMQLKHQRTADVIFAPVLPPGQCPDEARVMLETLLPPCGGAPRLLEISLAPGPQETASRPGWVKVVQAV